MTETTLNPVTPLSFDANGLEITDGSGDRATNSYISDSFAQERNAGTANQYGVGVGECNATVIDTTGAIAVSASPVLLFGLQIVTSGTTATVTGFVDSADAAQTIVFTASANNTFIDLKGAKLDTLGITGSVADDIIALWRLQG